MTYDASSIQQLTFREGVRKRVGIYLGSSDSSGVMAGFLEIVNNATDEFLVKDKANLIEIEVHPKEISVRDYGRGMPHGPNDKSKEVMIPLLTENHSGAKFDDQAYGGKALPNSTLLPTPNGFKQVGDVVVGDYLFDALGKPTEVIAVHPQKEKKQKWTVKLSDGREVICSPDHLWSYVTKSTTKVVQEKRGFRTSTTKELYERGIRVNQKQGYRFKIPVQKAVEYTAKEYYLDPYLMGLALGDGSFREHYTNKQFSYSSADEELVLAFFDLMGWEYKKDKGNNYSWTFKDKGTPVYVASLLTECPELINTYSHEKFIPQDYLFGSIEQRIDLLNGLLDSDGSIDKNGHIDYHTNSDSLKEDFIQLCDSLGLMTTTYLDTRKNTSNVWKIRVFGSLEIKSKLFRLKRKKEILNNWINNGKAKRNHNYVQIVDIVPSTETTDMTCFEVDNEEHLFLTDRFVPTHNSRGLNGSGSAATCCSSDWFEITSFRDGASWFMRFEKGIPQSDTAIKGKKGKEGTFVSYAPSQEVFSSEPIHFDYDLICKTMEEYSFFNAGIKFQVTNGETGEVRSFKSKRGLLDFASKIIDKPINKEPIHLKMSDPEKNIDAELILQWTTGQHRYHLFTNGGENPDGGTPITGIKTSLTNFFKKNGGKDVDPELARNGLVVICSIQLKNPIYDGQVKSKIKNPELRGFCQRMTTEALTAFAETPEFTKVMDFLTRESRAEIAANRAREAVKTAQKDIERRVKRGVANPNKLKDAKYLGKDAILLIVEGDSAAGSMAMGRDDRKYGILQIKGKMINPFIHPIEEVFANEEVKLLFTALGITPKGYSAKKLRYGKVAIASDADKDGNHIALLILAVISNLIPELLTEGRVYRLQSPTHLVKSGKTTHYFYSDDEFKARKVKGDITLVKGLGELRPDQMKEAMFGENQHLTPFLWSDEANQRLAELMGKDTSYRKDWLFNHVDFSQITE